MVDFKIEFETPIATAAEPPPVPEKIRKAAEHRMRGLKRIIVQHEASRGRWQKINGFKLDGTQGKSTSVEVEAIGAAIMFAILAHFDQLPKGEQVPPPQNYRIFFHVIGNDGETIRPSTEYLFNPAEESGEFDDDENEAQQAAYESRMERMMMRLENQNEQIHQRNMDLCDKLGTLSTAHVANLAPFAQMMGFMGQAWMTGAQMQQNALHAMFDAKQAEIVETHADRRMDKILDTIKGPIGMLVKAKYGIDLSKLGDDDDDDDDEEDEKPAKKKKTKAAERPAWDGSTRDAAGDASAPADGAQPTTPAVEGDAQPADDADPNADKHPAAMLLDALAGTIRPKQWAKLAALLGDDMPLLSKLLEAQTDKAALIRYTKFSQAAGLEKMASLGRLLTSEQREILNTLQTIMERVQANWAD